MLIKAVGDFLPSIDPNKFTYDIVNGQSIFGGKYDEL